VGSDPVPRLGDGPCVEGDERVGASCDLVEERGFGLDSGPPCEEVVNLRENEGGEKKRPRLRLEDPASGFVRLL
jgi:hypothetical protein